MATYTIQPGDYVALVAFKHGFRSYLTIYEDGANAGFRAKRPNPDVLYPGDELVIPDPMPRNEPADTGKRHTFYAIPKTKVKLRLIVKNHECTPLADKRYTLRVGREVIGEGGDERTGKDGLIEHEISPSITQAELKVFLDDTTQNGPSWKLAIGHLNPISEVSGVKGRLNNLGFDCGTVNEVIDEPTVKALKAFREAMGISVAPADEGTIDEPTRARLQKEHDS
jgi:hypothetical protein